MWLLGLADSFAQELQATGELRLDSLLTDGQSVRDLGVTQAIDQPQPAHRRSFRREVGERALHCRGELRRFQVGLDLRYRHELSGPDPPPARHGGTLEPVECGVAHGEIEVVPHGASGHPVGPAPPDPEEHFLASSEPASRGGSLAKWVLGNDIDGYRIRPMPIACAQFQRAARSFRYG